VIEVLFPKAFSYSVEYPLPMEEDYDLANKLRTAPEAAARIKRILELVKSHSSTLIFVNSRTNAESLGHKFGILTKDIAVHHGSLSKEARTLIEDQFKAGVLKAIVCTSTLELGIDIGHVDLVIQYLSPRRVNSLIQRVGRSGHKLNLTSKGIIITAFPDDILESLAIVRKASEHKLEPVLIHENALDVLAHQLAGLLMDKGQIEVDKALQIFRRTYSYRNISKAKFLDVAKYLHKLGEVRLEGKVLKKTRKTRPYYYENLSMIPDEKRYPIIDIISDRKIGTLGDEFMALRARIGLNFICKGKVWRIVQIEDETGEVFVVPSEDPLAAIPGWDGEMLPIPFNIAQETGKLRHEIAEELKKTENLERVVEKLAKKFSVHKTTLLKPVEEIREQLNQKVPVPTHNHIVIEGFDRYVIVHACFGEVVNRTLGSIFDAILSDHELIVGWWNDGYRILIETPRKTERKDLERICKLVLELSDEEVEKAFNAYLEARFPFSYKMKFVAERFGALPRGRTMSPRKIVELPERFKKTPVYEETIREAMLEKVDISKVKEIMRNIKSGKITISLVFREEKPSPIAYHILEKYSDIPELMAPKHVLMSNINRMKKVLLARKVVLTCFSCGSWTFKARIKELSEKPVCQKCGSGLLAPLRLEREAEELSKLLKKRKTGEEISVEELEKLTHARRAADLVLSYGKKAIIALQVRGVGPETASRVLGKMHFDEKEFYMDLLKAKIQYLRTRPFWEEKEKFR